MSDRHVGSGGSSEFTARLVPADRAPVAWLAILVGFVLVAFVKPWQPVVPLGAAPAPSDARPTDPARAPVVEARPSRTLPPAEAAVAAICLEPGSWRSATVEAWRDQTVHVWRALEPVAARGPLDPSIMVVPAVGSSIPAIGFCAPVAGPDRPSGPVQVTAWRRSDGRAFRIRLRPLLPTGAASPFGGLYGPPATADPSVSWPDGVVIFRLVERESGIERWFGIEIRGIEPAPSGSPSSG